MGCPIMTRYTGTKSQILQQHINDIYREKVKSSMPKRPTKEHQKLLTEKNKLKKQIGRVETEIEKLEKKLGYKWSSWSKKLEVRYDCFVPVSVKNKLALADRLSSLGKQKEAREIWDELIKKYELDK